MRIDFFTSWSPPGTGCAHEVRDAACLNSPSFWMTVCGRPPRSGPSPGSRACRCGPLRMLPSRRRGAPGEVLRTLAHRLALPPRAFSSESGDVELAPDADCARLGVSAALAILCGRPDVPLDMLMCCLGIGEPTVAALPASAPRPPIRRDQIGGFGFLTGLRRAERPSASRTARRGSVVLAPELPDDRRALTHTRTSLLATHAEAARLLLPEPSTHGEVRRPSDRTSNTAPSSANVDRVVGEWKSRMPGPSGCASFARDERARDEGRAGCRSPRSAATRSSCCEAELVRELISSTAAAKPCASAVPARTPHVYAHPELHAASFPTRGQRVLSHALGVSG